MKYGSKTGTGGRLDTKVRNNEKGKGFIQCLGKHCR